MILRFFKVCSFLFLLLLLGCSAPETNPDGTKKDTRILPMNFGLAQQEKPLENCI